MNLHVGETLHESEDGVVITVYNQVHLEVPEALPVCLFGALMDAGPIDDGKRLALCLCLYFELSALHSLVMSLELDILTRWTAVAF